MALQRTIKNESSLEGMGIHTGKNIKVSFKPAPVNNGVSFVRTDLPDRPVIPATTTSLVDASKRPRRTAIGRGDTEIQTIEHLLATLCGLEIDNIIVELDGPELPGLDGSAEDFVRILKKASIVEQDVDRKNFVVQEPILIQDGDSVLGILPDVNFRVSYTLDYPTTDFKTQYGSFLVNSETFENEIGPSRTFCLEEEVEHLRSLGLGKGASLDNTVVVGKQGIVSGTLKFEDEFLRHKILDIIGDLYLLGFPIKGHVVAVKSGHVLNLQLLKEIENQKKRLESKGLRKAIQAPAIPKGIMGQDEIKKILPHRYPFLMIDRILELGDTAAVGIKNLTENDYFFAGHFPSFPVMPGVLILEALAQTGGVLMLSRPSNKGKIAYLMSVNNAKFRRIVKPGDQLRLEIEIARFKTKTGQGHGKAFVEDKLVAEADLMFVLGD
ncbi:MAG: UDP-3-O-[3-hydroxymyristoyl] N-acetylglucosamine deacetylase [Candidatus Omnitrophica bacterium]|nr:UDP-3-O-[3-hydroxymyristoyl] N-acetylglucosamine deacetylase [Candidatus Omnitrophota bacterium]